MGDWENDRALGGVSKQLNFTAGLRKLLGEGNGNWLDGIAVDHGMERGECIVRLAWRGGENFKAR